MTRHLRRTYKFKKIKILEFFRSKNQNSDKKILCQKNSPEKNGNKILVPENGFNKKISATKFSKIFWFWSFLKSFFNQIRKMEASFDGIYKNKIKIGKLANEN